MKLLFATLLLAGNLVNYLPLGQEVVLPIQDLLIETEFREYQRKSRYRDRIDLFRKVLDRRSDLLRRYLQRGELELASGLLRKIQTLSQYITEESFSVENAKDLHSTQVKKLEIRLRQQIESIKDLRTTVPFEYLEAFETTIQDLEDLRKALLRQMLGDTVGAIQAAVVEPPASGRRDLLVHAHRAYRDALRRTECDSGLNDAEADFLRAGSPFRLWASQLIAVCEQYDGQLEAAARRLEALQGEAERHGYRALLARADR